MLTNNDQIPSLRNYLIRGAFGSLVLKLSQAGFGFLLAVILARLLGVEGFGIYAFCLSIVNLLTIPAMLGGQNLLVREVAAYRSRQEFSFLRGLLCQIRLASTVTSIILSLIAAGIGWLIFSGSPVRNVFILSVCLVPLLTTMSLQNAAWQGLHRILLGQISLTLAPVLFVVLIGVLFLFPGIVIVPEFAIIVHIASIGLMVLLIGFLLRKYLLEEIGNAEPAYETSRWVKSMLPFLFMSVMQVFNNEASVVLLGILQDTKSVGLFRVAQRGADLIPFGLLAVNIAIAPTIAKLYAKGEKDRLQNIITKSILLITVFALPVALGLIFWGNRLISLVFGQEYAQAYVPLIFLCLGQLFNACMGSVGIIMNMIGLEQLVAQGVTIAAITNIVLNVILIPFLGPTGAAIATSVSLVIWNVLLGLWLYKNTGIISTIRFTDFVR